MNAATDRAAVALRAATDRDVPRLTAIYSHHVRTGLASFEIDPPDDAEVARRLADVAARGLPYLVAEADGRVVGYAYAAPYRSRPAYRYTLEDSVYVDPGCAGRGIAWVSPAATTARPISASFCPRLVRARSVTLSCPARAT